MRKKRTDVDRKAASTWIDDEEFARFFKEYTEDPYDPEADEELKAFITYRALYTLYVRTIDAHAGVKDLGEEFTMISNSLFQVEEIMCQLLNVITTQADRDRTARLYMRVLFILAVILFMGLGYLAYTLFWSGGLFPWEGIG